MEAISNIELNETNSVAVKQHNTKGAGLTNLIIVPIEVDAKGRR